MKMIKLRFLELLVALFHYSAKDGTISFNPDKTRIRGCSDLDQSYKVREVVDMWRSYGLVQNSKNGEVVIHGAVLNLLLVVSAMQSRGSPSWVHRFCLAYARIAPGKLLDQKPVVALSDPETGGRFGFNPGEEEEKLWFFDWMFRNSRMSSARRGEYDEAVFTRDWFEILPIFSDARMTEKALVGLFPLVGLSPFSVEEEVKEVEVSSEKKKPSRKRREPQLPPEPATSPSPPTLEETALGFRRTHTQPTDPGLLKQLEERGWVDLSLPGFVIWTETAPRVSTV